MVVRARGHQLERSISRVVVVAVLGLANATLPQSASGQQQIGSVGVQDATVAGALEVTNGRAVLVGNTTVTAKDHTAEIALGRGGKVLVCATSGLHVTAGKGVADPQPLMLSLDRGAIEVHMAATTSDVVMTPDLRFAIQSAGPLDLRLRVTRYGDTCVENVGSNAPLLRIADQFGDATYELHAGQHVLFEHGNLKEVVDRETSPCGCPPEPVVSVADAGTTSATPAVPGSVVAVKQAAARQTAARQTAAKQAEAEHPFPAAVSQGLAPSAGAPAAPAGVIHTQVAATLTFNGANPESSATAANPGEPSATPAIGNAGAGKNTGTANNASGSLPATTAPASTSDTVKAQAPLPPAPPSGGDIAHRIGRFFQRLFGKG